MGGLLDRYRRGMLHRKAEGDYYRFLSAKNLIPDELRKTGIEDNHVCSVSVGLNSTSGIGYTILYAMNGKPALIISLDKEKDFEIVDFHNIHRKVSGISGGLGDTRFYPGIYHKVLYLPYDPLSQLRISEDVDRYNQCVGNAKILEVKYGGVPVQVVEKSPLPLSKLSVI